MKKVLIVEDEILARLGLRQLVDWKKLDLELLPDATDGEEALEMIRNSRPDIILLDLNIPRVSGLEILEFLKKEEMQTRVIVVSCQEEFDVVKKAMKLGAYDYLRKLNLSSDELESILEKCLGETEERNKVHMQGIREIRYEEIMRDSRDIFAGTCNYQTLICILAKDTEELSGVMEMIHKWAETELREGLQIQKGNQYGYFLLKEKPEEDEAEVIRRVFELTNQRYSKMEICKLFNEEGVLTPLQSMSRRQKSDSKKAASRGLQWTSDMIRKIVDDKTYIGCMVYGKTKIPDPGTGKEVPVPRSQWKVMENHHEPIVSKEVFEKAQSLQIRYTKKSKFDRETTLLGGYVKCGNCHRSLTSSSPVHGHILYSCAYSKGKKDTGCFAGKADNKMLEHIVLAEIKAYLRQNISQEQMQQSMRKQHEDSIEAYKTENAECEKRQEQIKIQNRQNYEKYHEGQMNQKQFMEAKMQLEEEKERLQKRVQELAELINAEKDILMKKNVPVEQMLKYLGYEKLTREMLEEYVSGIYVYDDGRVEVEWG